MSDDLENPEHPVLALVHARALVGSQPGRRSDGARLGLLVEGGSRRAVVTSGMASAIEQLGLLNVFDDVYGISAGSINAAYLLAGQAADAAASYYTEMASREFSNLGRAFLGRPVVSIDYVLRISEEERLIDWSMVSSSSIPLHVLATRHSDLKIVDLAKVTADIRLAMKAALTVPFVAGPPVGVGDDSYFDVAVMSDLPYQVPFAEGCSHLLVLRSLPRGKIPRHIAPVHRLISNRAGTIHPELPAVVALRHERYLREMTELDELERAGGAQQAYSVAPHLLDLIPRSAVDANRRRLHGGAAAGFRALHSALGVKEGAHPFPALERSSLRERAQRAQRGLRANR